MENLEIWDQVEKTDPSATKNFNRGGGFKGTATNPTYLARKATSLFGPYGIGWGMDLLSSEFVQGHIFDEMGNREVVHVELWRLWYKTGDEKGEVSHYGQTTFVGKNKYGPFTDEEAPKKTKTDAMTKCLALLGFSADIHSGKYDDVKYVNDLMQESAKEREAEDIGKSVQAVAVAISRLTQAPTLEALQTVWATIGKNVQSDPTVIAAKDEMKAQLSKPAGADIDDEIPY